MDRKVQELAIQIPGKNILVQEGLEQRPVPTHFADRQVVSVAKAEWAVRKEEGRWRTGVRN